MNPYKRGVEANLYFRLRANAIAQDMTGDAELTDVYLINRPDDYRGGYYSGIAGPKGHKLAVDYHRRYCVVNLVMLFFTAACIGWFWEVFLHLVRDGRFVCSP